MQSTHTHAPGQSVVPVVRTDDIEAPPMPTADTPGALEHSMCIHAARIGRMPVGDCDGWLRGVCDELMCLSPEASSVAMVLVRNPREPGWLAERIECSSDHAGEYRSHLQKCRSAGSVAGACIGLPSPDDLAHGQKTVRRRDMIGDAGWSASPFRTVRSRLGLYEFAWSIARLPASGEHRVLVIQLDGRSPTWQPGSALAERLAVLTTVAAEAYASGPLAEHVRRESLLAPLSPMRRMVAPLLATGMSETEIAERISRSRHTVHEHTKAIYSAWNVRSRHELRDLWQGLTSTRATGPASGSAPGAPRPATTAR